MRHLFSSLRARLLVLVIAAYLPAVGMTLWAVQRDQQDARLDIENRLLQMLADASRENDAAIQSGRRIVGTWSQVHDVVYGDRQACETRIITLMRLAPTVTQATRIDTNGYVNCGGPGAASVGRYLGDDPAFKQALLSDSTALGNYRSATSAHEALVPLYIALRDSAGVVRGVLTVGVRLLWMNHLAREGALPQGTAIAVADSTGLILAALPGSANVGQRRPELPAIFEADRTRGAAQQGTIIRRTTDNLERLVAHRALSSASGSFVRLAIGVQADSAFAAPNQRSRVRLALMAVAAIGALFIAWVGAEIIVLRDVNALLAATRRLGTGDLTARTGVRHRRGEIAQLAQSFDTMASQLERRQERMRHAERMESLGRLAGGVAHDFNNMLTAIVGSADLALHELPTGHPARADLVTIKSSASRSSTLTRQLLDFSRRSPLVTAPHALAPLVRDAAALLGRTMPANVRVVVRTNSTHPVRTDAGRIEQALLNLAVNARDAMPNGGTLTITLDDVMDAPVAAEGPGLDAEPHEQLPDGPPAPRTATATASAPVAWVRLAVTDTGHGMPPDIRRRIFEPFFTTKPVGQGTGLGLSMVYGTVQHHGGQIQVDSTPGEGTTVAMWFPAATVAEPAPPLPSTREPREGRRARVLVAEDQPEVRALMERVLVRAGFDVTLAIDGAEALTIAKSLGDRLDLVITDYDMPHHRGDAVAKAIRQHHHDMPLLLMSGFTSEGWPSELVDSPHTVVLEKPFGTQVLLEAIERALSASAPH